MAVHEVGTDAVQDEDGHFRGKPRIDDAGTDVGEISDDDDGCQRRETDGEHPAAIVAREESAERAEDRDQREGADAGDVRRCAFALQAHEQAESQGNADFQKNGLEVRSRHRDAKLA